MSAWVHLKCESRMCPIHGSANQQNIFVSKLRLDCSAMDRCGLTVLGRPKHFQDGEDRRRRPPLLYLSFFIVSSCSILTNINLCGTMLKYSPWVVLAVVWGVTNAPFSVGMTVDPRPPRGGQRSSGAKSSNAPSQQQPWKIPNKKRSGNNTSRNTSGYALRAAGIRVRSKTKKKTPRWEKEGDALYQEVQSSSNTISGTTDSEPHPIKTPPQASMTMQEAEILLASLATLGQEPETIKPTTMLADGAMSDPPKRVRKTTTTVEEKEEDNDDDDAKTNITKSSNKNKQDNIDIPSNKKSSPPSNTLWGNLPVGPVLKSRLLQASFETPTPVQTAAFSVLTSRQRNNAVLASPTGSGKSLAYLLPLLSTSARTPCEIVIVTPTIELAIQLQRQVDSLWPLQQQKQQSGTNDKDGGTRRNAGVGQSLMHVVGVKMGRPPTDQKDNSDTNHPDTPTTDLLLPAVPEDCTILAGTPRTLRKLLTEVLEDPKNSAIAKALCSNLRTVVLDEADRLLNTEGVARAAMERAKRKEEKSWSSSSSVRSQNKPKKQRGSSKPVLPVAATQTELLLSELPVRSLQDIQLVCASATVGRTLRRQLMELLQVPSIDKAAILITGEGDERTKKNATRRKSSLVPDTLTHQYHLLPSLPPSSSSSSSSSKASKKQKKNGQDDPQQDEVVAAMWQVMQGLEIPAPLLVFPGRAGVERVQKFLQKRNCDNVRTLASSSGDLWSSSSTEGVKGDEERIESNLDNTSVSVSHPTSWNSVPIFVVPERFGRGLDLPGVRYVLLLSPPSSAAGYAHLSGRTGRNGNLGTSITFVRPREAGKLVAIATALGLPFEPIVAAKVDGYNQNSDGKIAPVDGEEGDGNDDFHDKKRTSTDDTVIDKREGVTANARKESYSWAQLSEASLQRKTIAQLTDYLENYGASVPSTIGNRPKKADYLAAVHRLHQKGGD